MKPVYESKEEAIEALREFYYEYNILINKLGVDIRITYEGEFYFIAKYQTGNDYIKIMEVAL